MTPHVGKKPLFGKVVFGLLLPAAILWGAFVPSAVYAGEQEDTAALQLNQVFEVIRQAHISGIQDQELANKAIKAMVESLNDPYTTFMDKEEFDEFMKSMDQQLEGIGVRVGADENGFYIAEVLPGTPAEEGGLAEDDYIVAVDGKPVSGLELHELTSLIKGTAGTKVTVDVQRGNERLEFVLERRQVQDPVVTSKVLNNGAGYIRLSSFSTDGGQSFIDELAGLKAKGITGLILDLRDNTGGVLETAQNIAKQFVKEGTFLYKKGRDQQEQAVTFEGGTTVSFPVIVLVNEYSASATEALVGVLQDYGVATIIGKKTFGKGSVQEIYRLAGDAAIKVTTEEYLTPKKRPVNNVGLEPDIVVEGAVPQLLTALRHIPGGDRLELIIQKHSIVLNGGKFLQTVPVLREGENVYVHSRALAALLGGEAKWDEKRQAVDIVTSSATGTFTLDAKEAINRDGISMILLDSAAKRFPQLQWSADQNEVEIRVKKE